MNNKIKYNFILLFLATMFFGSASGIFISSLNNYLQDIHSLDAMARGLIELPREIPGFLIIFVTGILVLIMRETKIAAAAMILTALGAIGLGYIATDTLWLVVFIIIWSMGDHIIFALEGPIALTLAKKGSEGHKLGQLGGARNIGILIGLGSIYILSKTFGDVYYVFYSIAAASAFAAGICFWKMDIKGQSHSRSIVFKKKYSIFYAISALFGVRKQIFMAFGGWVLVSIHGVSISTIALLYFIAAVTGVFVRPLLGDVIDWCGERFVLATDEILLILICLTYAFAGDLFSANTALYVLYAAYILDSILFALRIARTTYLKKIADDPSEITPTISMGVTIDHVVAMSLPILSGYLWEYYGFRWVFYLAASIAFIGFFICLQIKVPSVETPES